MSIVGLCPYTYVRLLCVGPFMSTPVTISIFVCAGMVSLCLRQPAAVHVWSFVNTGIFVRVHAQLHVVSVCVFCIEFFVCPCVYAPVY